MGITFRKSFRILPGVWLNLSRHSRSLTFGKGRGPRRTYSSTGRRTTSFNLPGPFGYRRSSRSTRR